MKPETRENFVWVIVWSLMSLVALVSIVFFAAWWHLLTLCASVILARVFYTDDAYDTESVQSYFSKKRKEA